MPITEGLRRVRHRVGRRGASLLFLAMLDVVYGTGLTCIGDIGRANPTYQYAASVAPLGAWAALWLLVAAVCAVQAFMIRDQLAFGCAVCLKILWGGLMLIGWLTGDLPRGYVSAAIWGAFGAWVFIISGWTESENSGARR